MLFDVTFDVTKEQHTYQLKKMYILNTHNQEQHLYLMCKMSSTLKIKKLLEQKIKTIENFLIISHAGLFLLLNLIFFI